MGRKPVVEPSIVIEAILLFKDNILYSDDDGKTKIKPVTDPVWQNISKHLDGRMSIHALHIFAQQGRHGIETILGISDVLQNDVSVIDQLNMSTDSDDSSDCNSDISITLPSKKFVFTFSPEEWHSIQPEKVLYKHEDKKRLFQSSKVYFVLPQKTWTPLLAEHFWEHTQLPCCLSFRKAKVHPHGQFYIKAIGKCSICDSHFEGMVLEKPSPNSRVLMECSYTGNFNEVHKAKKCRMIGPMQNKTISAMVIEGHSSESFREIAGVRLIKSTDGHNPYMIPTGNALCLLKSRTKDSKKNKQRYSHCFGLNEKRKRV